VRRVSAPDAEVRGASAGDFPGAPRRSPGAGFAVRSGLWRWALAVATERRDRPAGLARPDGPALVSRRRTVGATRMHARVSDDGATAGTTALLVHGVIVSSRYLMPLGVELAGDRAVLIPDLPGYGLSDRPRTPPSIAALADAVVEFAVAAGHERVSLVANSFGAQVAVEAALRHPGSVARLVLLAPTVDPAARGLAAQYVRWQRNAPDEHLSVLPIMARDLADIGPSRAAGLLRLMLDDRIEDKLGGVPAPTLVVRGGRDRVVPAAWAECVTSLLPDARLETLPGYAHMAHYSGALALAALLRPFLAGSP
jgi:2-hydroxy-6-oxonona-2,4-dienedioate hydrolase